MSQISVIWSTTLSGRIRIRYGPPAVWNKLPPQLRTEEISREQVIRGLEDLGLGPYLFALALLVGGASVNICLRADADKLIIDFLMQNHLYSYVHGSSN